MSKYVIECPDCGKYVEVGTGLFAKKNVKCTCGRVINASADKMTSKCCPHCGNTVIYDQSKGESALCPVCHGKINTSADKFVLIKITCPSCACEVMVDKNATNHTCSLCGTKFDVQKRIAQEEVKKNGAVSIIKWEANNDIFVWKHPQEDFYTGRFFPFPAVKASDLADICKYQFFIEVVELDVVQSDYVKSADSYLSADEIDCQFISKIISHFLGKSLGNKNFIAKFSSRKVGHSALCQVV